MSHPSSMPAKYVSPLYVHYSKVVAPGETMVLGTSRLKWYEIAKPDAPVNSAERAVAQYFLRQAATREDWTLDDDVGFVILHRCGEAFYFLAVCSWRGDNELWQTVYFKPGDETPSFALYPQGFHKGTFCIWEAGVAMHEVAAWSRYLRSPRDAEALDRYLNDRIAGAVE